MNAGSGDGLKGALAPLVEKVPPGAGEEEQRDLLADQPLFPVVRLGAPPLQRAPGRPPGARNRRTKEWTDYILSRYRSPLIGLAEVVSTPWADLAEAMGCNRLEAAEFWRKCAKDLADFVHQKQPTAIDVQGASAGMLAVFIGTTTGEEAKARSAFGLELMLRDESEENQGLSGEREAQSDAPQSDGGAK